MATTTNVEVILGAKDNASGVIRGVGDSAKKTGSDAQAAFTQGGIAAGGFLAAILGLGKAMASVAGDFEQNRISFETMLGSAEKGRKALTDLSNFAVKTPFELPQLMSASKSLLAYGVEAENLIPTLRQLGDIASGVGMDKLPNLILAFGQVKAATRLTGMELRQFTEAGVPLLQLLVDEANKAGGSWQMVGGGAKKAKVDVAELNDKLAIARQRLNEANASGKAKQSTLMSLANTIQNYEQKLAGANATGGEAKRVWVENKVTVAQMKEMISDGAVSFEMVQKALANATGEGGRFFQMMEKQSKTFGGVMSNIKDQVTRSLAEIAGIDIQAGGLIREGSLFAMMKQGAEGLLAVLNVLTPKVSAFITEMMKNKAVVMAIAGAVGGAAVLAFVALWSVIGAGVILLGKFIIIGAAIGGAIGLIVEALGGWENVMKGVQSTFNALQKALAPAFAHLKDAVLLLWDNLKLLGQEFGELMKALKPVTDFIGQKIVPLIGSIVVEAIKNWIENLAKLIEFIAKVIGAITDFSNFVQKEFPKAKKSIEDFISNSIKSFQGWVDDTKTLLEKFKENAETTLETWTSNAVKAFDKFKTDTETRLSTWVENTKQALEPWREDFLGTLGKTLEDAATAMYNWDMETIGRWIETWNKWSTKAQEGLTILGETLTVFFTETLPTKFEEGWISVSTSVTNFFTVTLPEKFTEGWNIVSQSVTVFFTETLPTKFNEGWAILSENVMNFFTKTLPEIFTNGWNTLQQNVTQFFTETLPTAFSTGWENLKTMTMTKLNEMWTNFIEGWRQTGEQSPTSFLDGWLSSEPSMAGKVVETILKLIGIILLTLVVGLIEVAIRGVTSFGKSMVDSIIGLISGIKEAINRVINAIKEMIDNFKPKFTIGLELPDIVGAWNSLKAKAKSIGIPGFQTGGIVPGPIGSPQLAMVHGGEEIKSVGTGSSSGGGGGVTFNVSIGMYAGSETEKRNVARHLYGALLQVAQSQNKTVQEYMGG